MSSGTISVVVGVILCTLTVVVAFQQRSQQPRRGPLRTLDRVAAGLKDLDSVTVVEGTQAAPRVAKDRDHAQIILEAWTQDECCTNRAFVHESLVYRGADDGELFYGRLVSAGSISASRPRPGVVIFHTAVGPHDLFLYWKAEKLAAEGWVVLIADMLSDAAGRGWEPEWSAAVRKPLTDDRALNRRRARAAIDCIKTQAGVDASRVAAFG